MYRQSNTKQQNTQDSLNNSVARDDTGFSKNGVNSDDRMPVYFQLNDTVRDLKYRMGDAEFRRWCRKLKAVDELTPDALIDKLATFTELDCGCYADHHTCCHCRNGSRERRAGYSQIYLSTLFGELPF